MVDAKEKIYDQIPERLLDYAWEDQREIFQGLRSSGAREYFSKLRYFKDAFVTPVEEMVGCMDEGTPNAAFHIAGSGILLGNTFDGSVARAVQMVKDLRIPCISWHHHCGAAALFAQRINYTDNPDKLGREFVMEVAKRAEIEIHEKHLQRPPLVHRARAVFVDGSSLFHTYLSHQRIPGFPSAFTITANRQLGQEVILEQMNIALSIATGAHGFGNRITSEEPFWIIGVNANVQSSHHSFDPQEMEGLLKEFRKSLTPEMSSRVRFDSFDAPDEFALT